jgi:hypothetical protein
LLMWMHWPSPPLHGPPPTLPRRSALQMRCTKTQSRTLLWLSPSAWDQLAILLHQLSLFSMNSYVMNSYFNANIWIHIIHCSPQSYEFISFVNDMNSYSSSMIWIHIQLYHMNSYLSSMIWIHIRMVQSIPNTRTILQMATSIHENRMVTSINNLLRLTSDLNSWSSKMVISHGDQSLDISSAAQGSLSSTPIAVFSTVSCSRNK